MTAERIAAAVAAFGADMGPQGLPSSDRPGVLPSGGLLTSEPGGQLELSSLPADSLAECVRNTAADVAVLRAAVADAGLELAGFGLDPFRPPRRVLQLPRYAAMEAFFDRGGDWGRQMMRATASVQVCLDAGEDDDALPATASGGGCCTRSGQCSWPRSRARRCATASRPAGCRRGSRCGRTWIPAAPGRRC